MPATRAVPVARMWPSWPRTPSGWRRPNEVRHEERRDEAEQEQVVPAPAPKGDPVGHEVADEKCDRGCDAGVDERTLELSAVAADRTRVVVPGPGEGVTEVDAPRLERLIGEKAEG